jgi:hypothetical protein
MIGKAQDKPVSTQAWEYGMVKWDGPDKIQIITPEKTECLRVFKTGAVLPPEIHDEEFCVVWALNRVAKDGWEPITLHATRILIKRQVSH